MGIFERISGFITNKLCEKDVIEDDDFTLIRNIIKNIMFVIALVGSCVLIGILASSLKDMLIAIVIVYVMINVENRRLQFHCFTSFNCGLWSGSIILITLYLSTIFTEMLYPHNFILSCIVTSFVVIKLVLTKLGMKFIRWVENKFLEKLN